MIFSGECGGPLDAAKNGSWKEPSFELKRKEIMVADDLFNVKLGSLGSRNLQTSASRNGGVASSTVRVTQMDTQGSDAHEEQDDLEGINAFNTDDALRQEENPTHAINPATIFG